MLFTQGGSVSQKLLENVINTCSRFVSICPDKKGTIIDKYGAVRVTIPSLGLSLKSIHVNKSEWPRTSSRRKLRMINRDRFSHPDLSKNVIWRHTTGLQAIKTTHKRNGTMNSFKWHKTKLAMHNKPSVHKAMGNRKFSGTKCPQVI